VSVLWDDNALSAAIGGKAGFSVSGISIDTRTIKPGDLFVALKAERDGHDFVADAFAKGAAGALVSRPMPGPVLVVEDTLAALGRLAAAARARTSARVIAVTGSVGKTTTKEMLRRCLAGFGAVHAAEASFNNHIGVPLTLGRLPAAADFAVFEIGMNHPGEIQPLSGLVRPYAAIITCVDRAHLGLMGSEAAIAAEKAAIFAGLEPGGAGILPEDSKFLALLRSKIPADARQIVFGTGHGDVRLLRLKSTAEASELSVLIAGRTIKLRLAAPGLHMALNACAVLAAAAAIGLDPADAAASLEDFAPFAGRGARRALGLPSGGRILLLDESYNASGASMRAALEVLALQPGRRIAVLGDMLELGVHATAEHLALKTPAGTADLIFTCGPEMRHLFDSLPQAKQGGHAADAASLAPLVQAALRDGDTVLVKGSYGSRMRDVISRLESQD
jgi:UDP-N-acetylmuramoyl-tripeptide--D-alanyl-D-alanine ligase